MTGGTHPRPHPGSPDGPLEAGTARLGTAGHRSQPMDSRRVLIVEPDGTFALSLASIFQASGCTTAVVPTATEAERV